MKNDSVREELESKISSGPLVSKQLKEKTLPASRLVSQSATAPPRPAAKKTITAGLISNKTSPTLVEFQNKNALLPDWRIQLQNAVQQRKGGSSEVAATAKTESEAQPVSRGNLALKTEPTPQAEIESSQNKIADPRVANAMRRISESRNNFFEAPAKQMKAAASVQSVQMRPFGVVAPSNNISAMGVAMAPARVISPQKPKLVPPPIPIAEKRDTNKLPSIEGPAESPAVVEKPLIERVKKILSGPREKDAIESTRIHITAENIASEDLEIQGIEVDEIEDLAPFSMRFGAGLFDFIIGGFATMLVLSPFAFTSENWFTTTVFFTFVGTLTLITFLYMTACLGFFGKTLGMRLFQLELVDAVENEYPTLRQAAVNTSVFLATVAFAGAPFFTIFFNEEKRALHDLVSGTILVREF